ncbi:MAG: glutamine amidotransferase [Deltaproteobacteria bacterium]|nr:glutamine amidotransferase [Deltaproteobacteria bacterium]
MPPAPPEFNDWTVALGTSLPGWALALLIAGLGVAFYRASRGLAREPRPWRRRLLLSLRLSASVLVALLLLEPAIQLLQVRRVKNRVAVLVDVSESMGLPARAGGPSRLDDVRALFQQARPALDALAEGFVFEFFTFAERATPGTPAVLDTAAADGRRSDLVGALEAAAEGGAAGRKLAGLLVFSDGADTEALQEGLTPEVRDRLEALDAPVHTFLAGSADALQDLAVTRVQADAFAFVRNALEVDATIRSHGLREQEVPVVLRREGRIVAQTTAKIGAGEDATVTFRFTPDTTGKFIYSVSVPVLAGESLTTNNQRTFMLKVIRDRIRVLQVAGRPSWDERFLRGLFKRDPNVDLISFFILRTKQDDTTVANSELSLIPFPTDELFTKQLKTFDLVIFQNFDYYPYEVARYLRNVADYVRDGGAFVMIGGEKSFGAGEYQGTYIEDILPVLVPGRGALSEDPNPFVPRLTDEGRRHPITQLARHAAGTEQVLASLPELEGMNLVRSLRPEAQVLLAHPFLQVDGQPAPVVAVSQIGRGRSMAVTSDSTWFWSLPAAGQGSDRRVYDRFWTNALRWLVRDPDLTTLRVRSRKDVYQPGEKVELEVAVRDQDYGAARGARVKAEVLATDGSRVALLEGTAGEDGVATLETTPPTPGAYKVIASASMAERPDTSLGQEVGVFAVRRTSVELLDPAPRPAILEAIAEATKGSHHALPLSNLPELDLVDPEIVEVGRKKSVDLWDRWGFIALILGLLSTEWWFRRRWGHL